MDSVISWAIMTAALLGAITWLLISRAVYLDSIHKEKPSCVWANTGRGKDWQAFYTGHTY